MELFSNIAFPALLPSFGVFNLTWLGATVALLALGALGYLIIKYRSGNFQLITTGLFALLISLTLLFEILFSRTLDGIIMKTVIFALVAFTSIFLIRSIRHETESKEEVEGLVQDLAEAHKDLQALDERKSEFVATAASSLKTPLTAIKGYASMLLEGSFGELSSRVQVAIERIFQSSQGLVVIIEDLTDILKIESGEIAYKFSRVDMRKLVQGVVDDMAISARKAGIAISFDSDKNEDYYTNIDVGKIKQVIFNLADNAVKYTPHGSIQISLLKDTANGVIILKISDSGIGMSKGTIKKIFQKFSRAEEASKFHTAGSGLGLYIVREILKKHGGHVWAESAGTSKGSTFYVALKEQRLGAR
ncbi:MAG: hypothetical protein BMS9Abin13_089 [Patescibacteria group bacterium]|nr:MAG: hypothetical protein BMS9Abin13_089 [Patescibacteria group bacterium]